MGRYFCFGDHDQSHRQEGKSRWDCLFAAPSEKDDATVSYMALCERVSKTKVQPHFSRICTCIYELYNE